MSAKAKHKELKRAVNDAEKLRRNDRTYKSWYDMKTLKKIKLKAKEKLNATKQKLFA